MSTLESLVWHILGYSMIPVILLLGIWFSSILYFLLLELLGRGIEE